MTAEDFQNKFLKIGYSKRKKGHSRSAKDRPFIGRKGIGKLALLSCAERVIVVSKVKGGAYVGGTIDNRQLDSAITNDLTPQQYPLGRLTFLCSAVTQQTTVMEQLFDLKASKTV